ncbi:hypothetical protein F4604DRAFT_647685 [Suillus subluteus]|nr:hypothetical protein F4604DRAFT_647685 [Suillus subluteus]
MQSPFASFTSPAPCVSESSLVLLPLLLCPEPPNQYRNRTATNSSCWSTYLLFSVDNGTVHWLLCCSDQPSNPYANLTQRMTRNAQLNAMCVLYPHLKLQGRPEYRVPRGAKDMGDGPSTLPTPQDNISEQLEYSLPTPSQAVLQDTLQPTHIPEHDSERLVDVSVTDLAAVTVRPTEEAPGAAESTSVMRPNKASKTARNLCALEWCAEMKQKKLKPLTKEFEAYWNKLKECPDQLKVRVIALLCYWL